MRSLAGRTAVVTGAASGIGHAVVRRFVAMGMNVVLADVDAAALERATSTLGDRVIGVRTDVSDPASVDALAARTMDAFGAVHVLGNIAGVESGGRFAEIPLETWRWVLGVNVMGTVNCCRTFLPLLRAQEEGHVVNTASTAAFSSRTPTFAPYIASKSAVLGLTESLAVEEAASGSGVGVSLLVPGPTRTQMVDAERNRPGDVPLTAGNADRDAVSAALRAATEEGMDPADTAGHVVDAILHDRFYVLTHPDAVFGGLAARAEWMRGGPVPPPSVAGRRLP